MKSQTRKADCEKLANCTHKVDFGGTNGIIPIVYGTITLL